jgi:hypothetical protein
VRNVVGLRYPKNWYWNRPSVEPGRVVVCDIDGVLADTAHRNHLLEGEVKDWEAFFAACGDDALIEETARFLSLLDPSVIVVLLTGRPVKAKEATATWLEQHAVRWDALVMRDRGDYQSADGFKQQSVRRLRAAGFAVELALEDAPRTRDMLRAEGIPCLYMHSGYHEG